MAEFFKSAARAGAEVRRLGQVGPEAERDQSLRALSKVAAAGMEALPPQPRRGISSPRPVAAQQEGTPEDTIQAILNAYEGSYQTEEPPPPQSEGTFLGDVGRSIARGGLSLGGGIYELGNIATGGALDTGTKAVFGTSGTEGISSARESLNQADSAELQRQRAELEASDGFMESFGTVLTNPRLAGSMLIEMVPQVVTIVGAARLAATRAITSAVSKGATKEAAEIAGQKAATRTALGLNAGLEGGMAAQDVRADIMRMSEAELSESPQYQALIEQGSTPEDARARLANDAAMVSAATAASISALSSRVFGTMEGSLAARGLAGDIAPKTAGEAVRRFGIGAAKESGQETFEEGGSQFGQNLGTFAAVDRNQDLFEGVPQSAGAGGALGLIAGGATNIRLPQGADQPAAPQAPQAPNAPQTTSPAAPPVGLAPQEFESMLESPEIVPYLSALYNQATENERTQLQELARRSNIQVDLAETSQNANIVGRGVRLIEQAPSVAQAFMASANESLLDQDTTALPPKEPQFTDEQIAEDIARNTMSRDDQIEANAAEIEASAREMGIAPVTQPGAQAEDQAIATPSATQDLGTLMRGYQRRAQNISSMPPGARRAAAISSISEMVGAGFTPEQANQVFGPMTTEQASAAVTESTTEVPAEIASQTTEATEPIADTNIGDAGGVSELPATSTTPPPVSQGSAPLQTVPSSGAAAGVNLEQLFGPRPTQTTPIITTPPRSEMPQVQRDQEKDQYTATDNGATVISAGPIETLTFNPPKLGIKFIQVDGRRMTMYNEAAVSWVQNDFDKNRAKAAGLTKEQFESARMLEVKLENDGISIVVSRARVTTGWDGGTDVPPQSLQFLGDLVTDPALVKGLADLNDQIASSNRDDARASEFITPFITETFGTNAYLSVMNERQRVADEFNQKMRGVTTSEASQAEPTGFVVPSVISSPDGPFVVKNGPTGKKRADDSPVHAFVSRSGKVVSFDEKAVRDQFPNKVWTQPKVEGVIALPEDAFATADEWVEFVFRHEEAHIKNPRMDGETTADYENRMNQIALTQMKGQEYADSIYAPKPVAEEAAQESAPEESTIVPKEGTPTTVGPPMEMTLDSRGAVLSSSEPKAETTTEAPQSEVVQLVGEIRKLVEKIDANTETTRRATTDQDLVFRPGTPGEEQDSPLSRGRNPNIQSGTFRPPETGPARDIVEQEQMRKETRRRRAERLKQKRPAIKPAPRRAPTRQGELGETPDVRRYQARAERIMTQLVSRGSVAKQIQSLEQKLAELEKNRTYGRSSVEYIFGQFAQAGALPQEDVDDLSNLDRNREMVTFLRDKINQLQKEDLANRAEAIRLNIQAVDDALTDLRIEMEDAGISQNIIDDVLLDKEMGVQAVLDGRTESIQDVENILDDTLERPEENLDLFGESAVTAAQVVDAIQNEVNTPRALMSLRAETEASEVGNLDIYDEMRRRGLTPDPELIAFASRPGVKYSLDFWIKKNQGRNPYTVREEWFGSLDLTVRQTGDKLILNELSQDERDLYNRWLSERNTMRDRLEQGDQQNESGGYLFDLLDNAFPHALFNKYPLSAMFDPSKLPEGDRPGLLALVDGNPEALPTLWYEDLRHVMSVRSDLEPQVRETVSEEEFARYEEYRSRKTRELLRDSQMLANSPAFSQLMQLKSFLSAEQFQQYYAQIQQANTNQHEAILQAAFEISEAQRLAQENNRDVDDATDAIMDAVYQQDEVNSASPDQMADATRTIDSDDVDAFPENVEDQPDPDGDPSDFVDRMRFRRGRYSGVISAAEMFAHLNKIVSGWKNAPQIKVLNNPMQLPDELRNVAMQKLGRSGVKGMIAPDGTVYIFSDFNENLEDAEFTLFHEVYGHFGLRQFLGNKLDQFLNTQYKVNRKVKAAADALMAEAQESGRGITQLEATEEAIADLAVSNEDPSLILKIITALQKFLRSIKMRSVADWMESKSGGELAYVLSQARRAVRDGRVGPLDGAPFDVRFNASKQPVEIFGTKNDTTTAYARYNPVLHQWTVFWDKDGLKSQGFGITTVDEYDQALAIVRQYGRAMSAKDFPGRSLKDPSSFKLQIPFPSDVKGWRRIARKAQIKLQNKLLPVYEVARWINANGGNTNLENVLKLHRGKIKPHMDEFNRKYLRPIAATLRDIEAKGGSIENIDLYLAARHAKERNARVQEINPNKKDGSGISNSDAARILQDFERAEYANELRSIGALLDSLSQAKISYMLQHGLISEQQAQALSTYEHYVSLSGNASDRAESDNNRILIRNTTGRSLNLRGSDVRRSTGRSTAAVDVLENTLNSYLGVIIRGQKNVVNQSVLQMVDDHPDPTFAVVNRIKTTRKLDVERLISDKLALKFIGDAPTPESGKAFLKELQGRIVTGQVSENDAEGIVRRRFEEAYERNDITAAQLTVFVKKLENASLRMGVLNEDGYVTTVDDPMYANDPNVLVVKDQGRMVTIEFMEKQNDPDRFGTFVGALSGMHNFSESETLGAFGAFNRFIGQLITSRNLTWVPVNWIRDIGTAYFNAAADPNVGPVLAKKMAREAPRAYKVAYKNLIVDDYADKNSAVYRFLKKIVRKPVSAEDQRLFEEFKKDGGETYFLDRKDIAEQIKAFQRELDPATGIVGAWEAYGKFADLLGQPAELSARFAAYKVLRQAGRSREEAAVYAKEITVNFEQAGSSAWIRSLILFFNPAVQGTARMFRDYSRRSGAGKLIPSKEFGSIVAGLAGLGILTGFFARAMGEGDDDEINDLDQIPSGKRATSVVLFPGMPMGAPIPLPYGWNVFYAMGHFAADSIFGDTPVSQTASRIASSAVNSFWPAGARDSGNFVKDTALSFVPTALTPAVDIWMNENRFGAPIAKERNPFTRAEEANAYMNFQSASPVSVYLMRELNDLTGGSQYRSGMIDINPAYVDYVLSSYLPGLPTDVGRTVNLGVNAAIGREVKNPPLPLVDRFGSKVSEGWNAGAFRRAQTYVETKYKDAISSQGAEREAILKEHPNLGGAKGALSRIDQSIRDIRTSLRTIEQNPNISFKEKVAARNKVEELEKAYYKQGVALAVKAGFKAQVIADN